MTVQSQPISTEGITVHEGGGFSATGREAVNAYAFVMLRRAVMFRMKTGMSMLRNQEAVMAQNYGWSTQKRFNGPKLLADLNKVGDEAGIPRAETK
jgi:hypothetical protein